MMVQCGAMVHCGVVFVIVVVGCVYVYMEGLA